MISASSCRHSTECKIYVLCMLPLLHDARNLSRASGARVGHTTWLLHIELMSSVTCVGISFCDALFHLLMDWWTLCILIIQWLLILPQEFRTHQSWCRCCVLCTWNCDVAPLPPLGHIRDVMLVWRKGNIEKNCLCITVLCTITMVHKDMSSSYRSVDCIGLWSCLV